MDALKLIPQIFFDVIARIVPGSVAFVILELTVPGGLWARTLERVAAGGVEPRKSATMAALVWLGASYVLGQLTSPAGKVVEGIAVKIVTPRVHEALNSSSAGLKWLTNRIPKELIKYFESGPGPEKVQLKRYDWLRLYKADAGALTAKIRAEYTMFFALSAILLASVPLVLISTTAFVSRLAPWRLALGLLLGAIVLASRGRDIRRTFFNSVSNFYSAATAGSERGLTKPSTLQQEM